MIIEITEHSGCVHAMGHRVAPGDGGEPELKRRCLEALSKLNAPPDQITFMHVGPGEAAPVSKVETKAPETKAEAATEPATPAAKRRRR